MASIKVDYEGIESDISTLTTNVKNICDSLDKINDIEKIVPSSWQSPASEQYTMVVQNDILNPISTFQSTLAGLIQVLVEISGSFDNLESIIGKDLTDWFKNLQENGKVLDLISFAEFISESGLNYDVNYLIQSYNDAFYASTQYGFSSDTLAKGGCGFFSMLMAYQLRTGHNLTQEEIAKLAAGCDTQGAGLTHVDRAYNTGELLGLDVSVEQMNVDEACEAVNNGKSIIFLRQGDSGHFRMITEVQHTENGEQYIVYDSSKGDYQTWTREKLNQEFANGTVLEVGDYSSSKDKLQDSSWTPDGYSEGSGSSSDLPYGNGGQNPYDNTTDGSYPNNGLPSTPSEPSAPSEPSTSEDADFANESRKAKISFVGDDTYDNLDLSFTDQSGKATIHFE